LGFLWSFARALGEALNTVDVVIPAFNAKRTVAAAIESVLGQSIDVVRKIIVVDDGSVDGTASFVRAINSDKIVVYSTENKGVSSARNYGISKSSAKWVAFLDTDDLWAPSKLEHQLSVAEVFQCHFVCGAIDSNARRRSGCISISDLLFGNFVATSSVIVERCFLEKHLISFNEEMSFAEDYLMWIQCLTVGKGFYCASEQTKYIRSHRPRYNWKQIFTNLKKLMCCYFLFLDKVDVSYIRKICLRVVLVLGVSRSVLSIGFRFLKSYFVVKN
jgi:glycosyltransferase involved in cell wall biosynthesis